MLPYKDVVCQQKSKGQMTEITGCVRLFITSGKQLIMVELVF